VARIWDISQRLRPGLPVWPGDTPYTESATWRLDADCPVNVARVTLSTHAGTHADAPRHFVAGGTPIGELGLEPYLGPCQVLDVTAGGSRIEPSEVRGRLESGVGRVLLRTYDRAPLQRWQADFAAVAPQTVDYLAATGVVLLGVDTPSLDSQDAKELAAHRTAHGHGMAILEGLVLDGVAEGCYELIALPLPLQNLDAAPVRAVLRELAR
jgi:arylformamidase